MRCKVVELIALTQMRSTELKYPGTRVFRWDSSQFNLPQTDEQTHTDLIPSAIWNPTGGAVIYEFK